MVSVDNAVQVRNADWNGLHTVGEDSWRLLLEMFLNSQDICSKSRETYSWALMRYFEWLQMTGRRLSSLTPADIADLYGYYRGGDQTSEDPGSSAERYVLMTGAGLMNMH